MQLFFIKIFKNPGPGILQILKDSLEIFRFLPRLANQLPFQKNSPMFISRYGGPKENTLLVALKMKLSQIDTNTSKQKKKKEEEIRISWEQFLRICALHIVSARINTVTKRPKIPPMPIYLYSYSACMCYLEDQM